MADWKYPSLRKMQQRILVPGILGQVIHRDAPQNERLQKIPHEKIQSNDRPSSAPQEL